MQKTQTKNSIKVIVFLILEVLCFTAFTLTNSVILYAVASVILIFGILFANMENIKGKEFLPLMVMLFPLLIFGIFLLISPFTQLLTGLGENLLAIIGICCFLILGYLSQTLNGFDLSKAMIVIYSGLTVYLIICFITTMVSYTPMYTWFNRNDFVYYHGERIPIGISAKMLYGFEILDVSINYYQMFATLLFTSVVGLRFINPKEKLREFLAYLGFALFGLINMIFTFNKMGLFTGLLTIAVLLLITFWPKNNKVSHTFAIICYVLIAIVACAAVVFLLNALMPDSGFAKAIAANGLLNKIFNTNMISRNYKNLISTYGNLIKQQRSGALIFGYSALLGYFPPELAQSERYFTNSILSSGNIWLDCFELAGLFGGTFFLIFGVISAVKLVKYFRSDRDTDLTRHLLVGFVVTFFVYTLFAYDMTPMNPHVSEFKIMPFHFSGLLMVVMFLLGHCVEYKKIEDPVKETDNLVETSTDILNDVESKDKDDFSDNQILSPLDANDKEESENEA